MPAHCEGPSLVLEKPLDAKRSWAVAAGSTRRRFAELPDVDACTRVEVLEEDKRVRVRASAADGRSVVRELSGPRELESTVVALLVLPPSARSEAPEVGPVEPLDPPPPRSDEPLPGSVAAKSAGTTTPRTAATPAPSVDDRSVFRTRAGTALLSAHGFDLGVGASGRSAGSLVGGGAQATIDWRVAGWLLGATARAEQITSTAPRPGQVSAQRSATLGAVFGRRFVTRPFALDVAALAPALSLRTSKWTSENTVSGSKDEIEPDEIEPDDDALEHAPRSVSREQATPVRADLEVGALVRGVVPLSTNFGAFLAVDAERTLLTWPAKGPSGEPRPSVWQAGVALGVLWSPP